MLAKAEAKRFLQEILGLEEFRSLELKYASRFDTIVECCNDIKNYYACDNIHWTLLSQGLDFLRQQLEQQDQMNVHVVGSEIKIVKATPPRQGVTKRRGRPKSKK